MADHFSIKDLPDTSKIEDSKGYLVEGKWLKVIFGIVSQLWRGENIQKGPNIRIRQLGLGGISISGANQSSSSTGITFPYQGFDASTGSTPGVTVNPGTHAGFPATIYGTALTDTPAPVLTITAGTGVVYAQVDFSYDVYGNITVTDNMINYSTDSTAPDSTTSPSGSGGGTGTLYQSLFAYNATVAGGGSGSASVQIFQYVGGSQNFGVCNDSLQGPWGV
jgi:hypothetical protein